MLRIGPALLTMLLLTACALGPDYQRPAIDAPAAYRHDQTAADSPIPAPLPADELPKGQWWLLYDDPVLNELQRRAAAGNRELQSALARLEQARAVARISDADLLPSLDLQPSAQRRRTAEDLAPMGVATTNTTLNLPLDLAYELDLWGRLRRQSEAAGADFAASAAEVENFRLMLHGEVARNYFALRTLDRELKLLESTLKLRRDNLQLVRRRHAGGLVDRLDVSRAESEVGQTEAEVIALRQQRAEFEHALALLLGQSSSDFTLPRRPADKQDQQQDSPALQVPAIDPGLPSALLQRRPDVAAVERRLMAASARIGAAQASFFPAIRLTGSTGFASDELTNLLTSGNAIWSLGGQLAQPLFDGGRRQAGLEQAEAVYAEELANYRHTILQAFKEVDDALVALKLLSQQQQAQQRALAAARQSEELSRRRYQAGLVSYLEVIASQRNALGLQRAVTNTAGQRLQANLALIKALGGGWRDQ
ncbi:MAG: efflux transporter outer membrane subunit [Desulfurivibrio sp.]|nr:efflux transporter outer membrane subunit [Desulfurivibrio sp.]